MKPTLAAAGVWCAFALLAFGFIYGLSWAGSGIPCGTIAKRMGFEHSWEFTTGCMINVRGQWVPLENYKVLE